MFRSLLILELLILPYGLKALPDPSLALNSAIYRNDLPTVQSLVASGVDINQVDPVGSTPLLTAILANRTAIAQYLLSRGANPNVRQGQTGSTALLYAVRAGQRESARILLAGRADVNLRYTDEQTVLHAAAEQGDPVLIELLCKAGASVAAENNKADTPLDEAVKRGRTAVVAELLRYHADAARVHTGDGRGPLQQACIKDFAALIPLLAASGADPTLPDRSGQTPLDLALDYKSLHAVEALLRLSTNNNQLQANFDSAMQLAIRRGRAVTAGMLLDAGWDVNRATAEQSSYLNDAALQGQERIVRLLLDRGARIDARNENGGTPLHDAALSGNPGVVKLLLDRGATIDARDSDSGATPLMLAASFGHTPAVALLLQRGANPALKDHHGRTALSRAREGQVPDLVKLLEKARSPAQAAS